MVLNFNCYQNLGNVEEITNTKYSSVSDLIKLYISLGVLPDINMMPLIPKMTNNTSPYGEASAIRFQGTGYAYKAFDDDESTVYNDNDDYYSGWIQYKFVSPVCVKKYHYYLILMELLLITKLKILKYKVLIMVRIL